MPVAVVTGSAGLVGSETTKLLSERGWNVVGVDNDMRGVFFGPAASTAPSRARLEAFVRRYRHAHLDIRDRDAIETLLKELAGQVGAIVHAAAQPSHDWAARDPHMDFGVNALGTLNLLEAARRHAPEAPFVFMSTNKVYGDAPNRLPLTEGATRYDLDPAHAFAAHGVDESMSIDQTLHSLFGASKAAADLLVQEYGRYFGMPTVCLRGGCLTGPGHAAAELHGFLAYLVKACSEGRPYRVFGHKAKQVRDNLHARDLAEAIWAIVQAPRCGEVYNMGGGPASNCSMLEAISFTEEAVGRRLDWTYVPEARIGDHVWYVSDIRKFQAHHPGWEVVRTVPAIIEEIATSLRQAA